LQAAQANLALADENNDRAVALRARGNDSV
jgi:hypothetical protein